MRMSDWSSDVCSSDLHFASIEERRMSADYDHGRRDGLRLALAILAAEEEKCAPLLGESRSWRTNQDRAVRQKALTVEKHRVQKALGNHAHGDTPASTDATAAAHDPLGLQQENRPVGNEW